MIDHSMNVYGFEYQVGGSTFAFDLTAESAEQAKERAKAMAGAALVGELIPCPPHSAA